jgi:hypothetical protein
MIVYVIIRPGPACGCTAEMLRAVFYSRMLVDLACAKPPAETSVSEKGRLVNSEFSRKIFYVKILCKPHTY